MKATELNTATDPLRRVPVITDDLPDGCNVWVQQDALKQMHHITLEYQGMQYHTSVTDAVLAEAESPAAVQAAVIETLLSDAGLTLDTKYKDITLQYWKFLIDKTITTHTEVTGELPRRIHVSQQVYDLMSQAEDDLPRATRRTSSAQRVEAAMPDGIPWAVRAPKEGDLKRFIRVR